MDVDFNEYKDDGNPVFTFDSDGYYISRKAGDRGRWLGVLPGEFEVGDEIPIKVTTGGLGSVVVTFWKDRIGSGGYVGSENLGSGAIDEIVTVKSGNLVRVEFRGWNDVPAGKNTLDEFTGIQIGEGEIVIDPPTMQSIANQDGDGEYNVLWTAVDGGELYELQENIDEAGWAQLQYSTDLDAVVTGRDPGSHCYRIRAIADDVRSVWSNVECTVVEESGGGLDAPTLYEIENPEMDSAYAIMWDAVTGADGYELEENMNERAWIPVEEYDGTAVGFDREWVPVGSYCYRVRAVAGEEKSDWSNVECTAHWTDERYHIYNLAEPDLTHEWTITIGDSGYIATSRHPRTAEDDLQDFIDDLAASGPEGEPELIPPSNL